MADLAARAAADRTEGPANAQPITISQHELINIVTHSHARLHIGTGGILT